MASYHDLLDAIARVRSVTGDPDAWKKGLTGADVATALNPASPPSALGAVLAAVTAAHPEVFLAGGADGPQAPPPRIGEGAAADAIRDAEAALARQNSDAAHVDLQVVTAVLNAHAAHDDGLAELIALQRDIEHAVVIRTDLDTPAGAREFQRFLIAKLRDIRNVVENSGLDATSKASLAAALASLYASSTPDPQDTEPTAGRPPEQEPAPAEPRRHRDAPAESSSGPTVQTPPFPSDAGLSGPPAADVADSPWVDPLWADSPWADSPPYLLPADAAPLPVAPPAVAPPPAAVMPPPAMQAPAWGAGLPAGLPGALGGGAPFGGGLPTLPSPSTPAALPELPTNDLPDHIGRDDPDVDPGAQSEPAPPSEESEEEPPANDDGTTVDLPDGDSVTAASPELAAAITAAVGGTPIPDAFRMQGITLPAPGSAVTTPVDPSRLAPGDIGLFTDRHALALGHGKALLDNQIHPVAGVSGPGFLGWQQPPEPEPSDAMPDVPAPNRVPATAPS